MSISAGQAAAPGHRPLAAGAATRSSFWTSRRSSWTPRARRRCASFIKRINREYGITIVLTTHLIFEAEELCDRVAIMDQGKIVSCDTVDRLRKHLQQYDSCVIACGDVAGAGAAARRFATHPDVVCCAFSEGTARHSRPNTWNASCTTCSSAPRPPDRRLCHRDQRTHAGRRLSQHGPRGAHEDILRAQRSLFAWLELKALRFYPINGVLQIIQSFVSVGIWFFVSLFLQDYAARLAGRVWRRLCGLHGRRRALFSEHERHADPALSKPEHRLLGQAAGGLSLAQFGHLGLYRGAVSCGSWPTIPFSRSSSWPSPFWPPACT